jgi:two-component sensor histidine kinase
MADPVPRRLPQRQPGFVGGLLSLMDRAGTHPGGPLDFARLPTGAKLLAILSAALLPLALIAVVATLQTSRVTDDEARARARIAANESGRAIAVELVGDINALRSALNALATDRQDAPSCARIQGIFARQAANGTRFAITDARGRILCGETLPGVAGLATARASSDVVVSILPGRGLMLGIVSTGGALRARAFFPSAFLADLGRPTSRATAFGTALESGAEMLPLDPVPDDDPLGQPFGRVVSLRTNIGVGDLVLVTTTRTVPLSSSFVVALLLPLLMWAAGAGISWFVVDRLLIRPLRQLRREVAAFTPGEVIDPEIARTLPAQEIRDLGDTFRAISRTVALHEAGLAEGLVRQTKLTREVHHRVKNNLQVIASLINFHARGARSADATDAYASIQRRVDALAVVHRHHFAEMEDNRGLNIRTMIGELASNLRATAPEGSSRLAITLDIDPFMVNQDVAVAIAFLVTEMVELAMTCDAAAQVRITVKPDGDAGRAVLRVSSRALVETDDLRELAGSRYGRVMEGLSRQLRSKLHHDPLVGAYEIAFAVLGRG